MILKSSSEKSLIVLLKKHDVHAFNELYSRYCKELYAVAYKRLLSKDDVQDIIQDIFISIWNNCENLDEELPLGPYLFKSLKFKIIDHFYKNKSRSLVPITDFNEAENVHQNTDHNLFLTKELEEVLNKEINNLPLKMKQVFLLSRKDYLSNDKIAERLSISSQTVKNQISLALKKLRQSLEDYNTL
nr:RNA polymerase sigma-70 factor [Pedobacter panaciterrae]